MTLTEKSSLGNPEDDMGKTIGEHLKTLVNEHPSKDIFVFYDANLKKTSITFKELHTLASRLVLFLIIFYTSFAK